MRTKANESTSIFSQIFLFKMSQAQAQKNSTKLTVDRAFELIRMHLPDALIFDHKEHDEDKYFIYGQDVWKWVDNTFEKDEYHVIPAFSEDELVEFLKFEMDVYY